MTDRSVTELFSERELRWIERNAELELDDEGPGALRRIALALRMELIYMLAPSAAIIDRIFRRKSKRGDIFPIGLTLGSFGTAIGGILTDPGWITLVASGALSFFAWISAFFLWMSQSISEDRSPLGTLVRNELNGIHRELEA